MAPCGDSTNALVVAPNSRLRNPAVCSLPDKRESRAPRLGKQAWQTTSPKTMPAFAIARPVVLEAERLPPGLLFVFKRAVFIQLAGGFQIAELSLEKSFQLADAGGMAHFAQGFRLNLADALPGHFKLFAYLLERS